MDSTAHPLAAIDMAVIISYILGVVIFGAMFMRKSKTLEGFVVGSRSLPGWALGLSILGTYLSSNSFIGNPGASYGGNWSPFVFSLTLPIACVIASLVFIPLYRSTLQTTAYEHLEHRFGYWARGYTSASLILLQIGRVAVVLYGVSLAMKSLLGWNILLLIFILGVLTIIYTVLGGIEAVVWTDVVQAVVLMIGAIIIVALLIIRMPGGTERMMEIATQHDKFTFGGWDPDFARDAFWTIFLFGILDNIRNFGIDQNFVQRFLSAKSDREARKSLWIGGLTYIPLSAMFFFMGTALFAFYYDTPTAEGFTKPDMALPYFIVHELPVGLTGLVIAAILAAAMSTLDSSINVCATVWTVDFHRRLIAPQAEEKDLLSVTRWGAIIFGALGTGAAALMIKAQSVLSVWWDISSIFGGGMVGLFLLGILVKGVSRKGALAAAAAGIVVIASCTAWASLGEQIASVLSKISLLPEGGSLPPFPISTKLIGFVGTAAILLVGSLDALRVRMTGGGDGSATA